MSSIEKMKRRYLNKPSIGDPFPCARCGTEKPFTTKFFAVEKRAPCGLASHCRECKAKNDKAWRDRNPHKNREYKQVYNERHRDRVNRNNALSRKRNPLTHCQVQARRRARKKNSQIEPVIYSEIFERDKGICHLCQIPIDPSLSWENPQALSFDHVIPLAKGGSHTTGNIRIAHRICNIRKSDKVILGDDKISWQRRFTREPVDPETLEPDKLDYSNRELEDYADAILRKDAKDGNSIHGENPILFEEHLYNRRRREILVTSGTPDDIQGLDDERGIHRGDGQKIFNRTHPQGRKVNSEHQRKKNGASYYR